MRLFKNKIPLDFTRTNINIDGKLDEWDKMRNNEIPVKKFTGIIVISLFLFGLFYGALGYGSNPVDVSIEKSTHSYRYEYNKTVSDYVLHYPSVQLDFSPTELMNHANDISNTYLDLKTYDTIGADYSKYNKTWVSGAYSDQLGNRNLDPITTNDAVGGNTLIFGNNGSVIVSSTSGVLLIKRFVAAHKSCSFSFSMKHNSQMWVNIYKSGFNLLTQLAFGTGSIMFRTSAGGYFWWPLPETQTLLSSCIYSIDIDMVSDYFAVTMNNVTFAYMACSYLDATPASDIIGPAFGVNSGKGPIFFNQLHYFSSNPLINKVDISESSLKASIASELSLDESDLDTSELTLRYSSPIVLTGNGEPGKFSDYYNITNYVSEGVTINNPWGNEFGNRFMPYSAVEEVSELTEYVDTCPYRYIEASLTTGWSLSFVAQRLCYQDYYSGAGIYVYRKNQVGNYPTQYRGQGGLKDILEITNENSTGSFWEPFNDNGIIPSLELIGTVNYNAPDIEAYCDVTGSTYSVVWSDLLGIYVLTTDDPLITLEMTTLSEPELVCDETDPTTSQYSINPAVSFNSDLKVLTISIYNTNDIDKIEIDIPVGYTFDEGLNGISLENSSISVVLGVLTIESAFGEMGIRNFDSTSNVVYISFSKSVDWLTLVSTLIYRVLIIALNPVYLLIGLGALWLITQMTKTVQNKLKK